MGTVIKGQYVHREFTTSPVPRDFPGGNPATLIKARNGQNYIRQEGGALATWRNTLGLVVMQAIMSTIFRCELVDGKARLVKRERVSKKLRIARRDYRSGNMYASIKRTLRSIIRGGQPV